MLSHLRTALTFLSRALAPAPLRRIARAVLATISSSLFDSVLRASFSAAGAAQLNADLDAICAVVDEVVGAGVAASGLRRCLEGAKLVGLPVKGGKQSAAPQAREDDGMEEWDAWAVEDIDADAREDAVGTSQPASSTRGPNAATDADADSPPSDAEPGLWEVENRLFADNASARAVLEELDIQVLDEKEARRVLRLRVELAG